MKNLLFLFILPLLLSADWCEITGKVLNGGRHPTIFIKLQDGAYIYADSIKVSCNENPVKSSAVVATKIDDNELREEIEINCFLEKTPEFPLTIDFEYQGCMENECFLPQKVQLVFSKAGMYIKTSENESNMPTALDGFTEVARFSGYKNAADLLEWIDNASFEPKEASSLSGILSRWGVIVLFLLVLAMGATLNMTPCVLPMIPINLAVIGAASKKLHGAIVYASGMALAYGALGIITVLTGSQFGALNDSWLFNGVAAIIFIILALAMFDVFSIDFTRWRKTVKASSLLGVFALGAMTALLSGACVAPVLISVLLFSAQLYSEGNAWALSLPFILGIGMAAPWPILATGMSMLPKPGAWMTRVRQALGVIILLLAGWYLITSYKLIKGVEYNARQGWQHSLEKAVAVAKEKNTPLLIEFYGRSCKACVAMHSVLQDKKVAEKMSDWAKVSIDATDNPIAKEMNVIGVPTYILFK